jgi:hypothetical protein
MWPLVDYQRAQPLIAPECGGFPDIFILNHMIHNSDAIFQDLQLVALITDD